MPADANLVLQASVTKVDSFNSAGVSLPAGGGQLMQLMARVVYSAASEASGSKTVKFKIQHSDNDSTYYDLATGDDQVITLTTTDQAGEVFISVRTKKAYVRLVMTLSASTNSPTITYQGHLVLSRP